MLTAHAIKAFVLRGALYTMFMATLVWFFVFVMGIYHYFSVEHLAWDKALAISALLSGVVALAIAVTTWTLMYAVTVAALGFSWITGKFKQREQGANK
ncbi:MAG: hypothetical protein B7Z70_10960 [Acidithiobacillus ferrivorans]|uniref:Uncharacterized protein n=1 Tax=Acidithiobacillus ferrivorans TaxID=160808 RepID=A0A257SSC8_9PROT|nr:MAG: hypothetical protein B7Z70_10960 [Acidithiobacillus ferrivorans]